MQGILPVLGGADHVRRGGWSVWLDYDQQPTASRWTVPGLHWEVGGIFLIALGAALVGVLGFIFMRVTAPAFFKKQTLTRATPTLVPDE